MACQVKIGQGQRGEGPACILGQAPVPYLGKAPQPLDDRKHVLHRCTYFGLAVIFCPFGFINLAGSAYALVRKILRLWRLALNRNFDA
jgi:hypothetical protein